MRYYRIVIRDPKTGLVYTPPGFGNLLGTGPDQSSYSSFVNGKTLPGAWNIDLDIPVIDAATPQGFADLRVWGISVGEIGQAKNLTGFNIAVYGGFQKGLPAANPNQAGLLVQGYIFQCFGNWIGTDMTLDFVIAPGSKTQAEESGGPGTVFKPKNFVLNWTGGSSLSSALQSCLQAAFPGYKIDIRISANIVRPTTQWGSFPAFEQLAQYVRETSLALVKTPNYPGVALTLDGTTCTAQDGTSGQPASKAIAFQDLIGQPTWIGPQQIQFKTAMRADIAFNQPITMPPTRIINTAAAYSAIVNQDAIFKGGFNVNSIRHVGSYRQPSADAWVTVFEAIPKPSS